MIFGLSLFVLWSLCPADAWPDIVPSPCHHCESRSWACRRHCSSSSSQDYVLDFTYAHEANTCTEIIPWNSSTVVIDKDIWCFYPQAQMCRIRGATCNLPMLGCDNMHKYTFNGVGVLEGCSPTMAGADDLLLESCSWVCKHRRPVARCQLRFDPHGRLKLGGKLDKCWIDNECRSNKEATVMATCKPHVTASTAGDLSMLETSGSLVLYVANAMAFLSDKRTIIAALKDGMLSSITELHVGMLTIFGVNAQPRRLGRILTEEVSQEVYVNYTVKITGLSPLLAMQHALMVDLALQAVKASTLATAINTQLSIMGLSAAVNGVAISVSPLRKEDLALEEPSAELSTLAAMHSVFSRRFGEASEELCSLQEDIEKHNETSAELKLLRAKHAAAAQELATLRAAYADLEQSLEKAQLALNATNFLLHASRQNVLDTAQKLVTARGSVATIPATFDDMKEAHLKAERLLLQALANYSSVKHEMRQSVGRHQQAARSVADLSMELGHVRKLIWQVTHNDLAQTRLNLSQAILREQAATEALTAEQAAHEETRQQLWQARASHKQAAEQVEILEETSTLAFFVCIAGLAVAIGALVLVLICWYRDRWDSGKVELTPVVPFDPNAVVEGNPIGKAMPQTIVAAPCRGTSNSKS